MTCQGVIKDRHVELEGDPGWPDGVRVRVTLLDSIDDRAAKGPTLGEWLEEAGVVREQLPSTPDSDELIRQMRDERSG